MLVRARCALYKGSHFSIYIFLTDQNEVKDDKKPNETILSLLDTFTSRKFHIFFASSYIINQLYGSWKLISIICRSIYAHLCLAALLEAMGMIWCIPARMREFNVIDAWVPKKRSILCFGRWGGWSKILSKWLVNTLGFWNGHQSQRCVKNSILFSLEHWDKAVKALVYGVCGKFGCWIC